MSWVDDYVKTKARQEYDRPEDGSLKKWKSKEKRTSSIVWHHTQVGPQLYWSHQFPRKVTFKDKDTGEEVTHYWGRAYNCFEDESYLLQQYRWKNGEPAVRPKKCPLCKMAVWLREQVESGDLDWLKPVFEFNDETVLVASGLYGYFSKKLEAAEIAEMKKAGFRQSESWKQSSISKPNWLFTVLDNDAPDDGIQVVSESNLLGEKMQDVLQDTMESLGVESGDYCKYPYALEWVNDPGAKSFGERYKARRIERIELTEEIEAVIRGDVPQEQIDFLLRKPDVQALRSLMEEFCVLDGVPFDEFFKGVEGDEDPNMEFPPKEKSSAKKSVAKPAVKPEAPKAAPKKVGRAPVEAKPEPKVSEGETLPCDKCGFAMGVSETECRKCGQKYALSDDTEDQTEF